MNELTEEQIKELWEWCGFQHIPTRYCEKCHRTEGEYWIKDGIGSKKAQSIYNHFNLVGGNNEKSISTEQN